MHLVGDLFEFESFTVDSLTTATESFTVDSLTIATKSFTADSLTTATKSFTVDSLTTATKPQFVSPDASGYAFFFIHFQFKCYRFFASLTIFFSK